MPVALYPRSPRDRPAPRGSPSQTSDVAPRCAADVQSVEHAQAPLRQASGRSLLCGHCSTHGATELVKLPDLHFFQRKHCQYAVGDMYRTSTHRQYACHPIGQDVISLGFRIRS